jgi:hypothetical protein
MSSNFCNLFFPIKDKITEHELLLINNSAKIDKKNGFPGKISPKRRGSL